MLRTSTLMMILAGLALSVLPLLAQTHPGMGLASPCRAEASPLATSRDWLGSLQGWTDSAAVLAWRQGVAASKGRAGPCD